MKDFKSLGLAEPLLSALEQANYVAPTPIQSQAIPLILEGSDLFGIAQTGTGKTAAFALPILHRLAANRHAPPRRGCRALVLAPTRELAAQIADNFRIYGRGLGFRVATICGGASPRPQRQMLERGIDVLVATPGRLLDHTSSQAATLARTEILVLDEADQMLDLGFLPALRRIIAQLPDRRQTLLFSATMPDAINKLAATFLHQPQRVAVAAVGATADRVIQRVIHVGGGEKRSLLASLCVTSEPSRTLVFTRTKRGADKVAKHLEGCGLRVAAIHGNKSQGQRERALDAFRNAQIDVLVATDIAARGIDIDAVEHVINYELPDVPEAYVHRVGRTARAGASGRATSLCDMSERKQLRDIERLTGQKIPAETHDRTTALAQASKPMPQRHARPPDRADDACADEGPRHRKPSRRPASASAAKAPAKSTGKGHWWERSAAVRAPRPSTFDRNRRRPAKAGSPRATA